MHDLSFIIPIRVDSDDRINNCLAILRFLTTHFPAAEIQLVEQDTVSRTAQVVAAYPSVCHDFELNTERFNKARAVNKGALAASRALICMCDSDILLHPEAIRTACAILRQKRGRIVIPHNRIFVDISAAMKSEMMDSYDLDQYGTIRRFSDVPRRGDVTSRDCNGGIFLAEKQTLLLGGGLNTKMVSYGWEDTEFIRRFDRLGYYTTMLPRYNLVHLDHHRGADSRINEMFDVNKAEFDKVNAMPRARLEAYVESDLDIAPEALRQLRPGLRRRQALANSLHLQFVRHVLNKIQVRLQTYGIAAVLRSIPGFRRLRGLGN